MDIIAFMLAGLAGASVVFETRSLWLGLSVALGLGTIITVILYGVREVCEAIHESKK